jgi:hypothetical protein
METWHNKIHEILTYNPISRDPMDYYDNNELSNQLSPCTNFLLNTFINTLNEKNLILFFPDFILRPIPLLSYFYSYLNKKSTLVFTQKGQTINNSPIDLHLKNYYMLNWDGEYLFYDIPVGIMTNDNVKAGFFPPRVTNRNLKKKYVLQQEKNFLESETPKILFYQDKKGTRILKNIQNLIIGKKKINENIDINIGCVIFENMDRFIYSNNSVKIFLKWLKENLPKDTRFIFHFSNPQQLEFINKFKNATNSLVLPFTFNLLNNNTRIKDQSINYFNSEDQKPIINILNRYNLDSPNFYNDNKIIKVLKPLEKGNIDYHFKIAQKMAKIINKKKILNKGSYYTTWNILNRMPNLVINPSKYKLNFEENGEYLHYGIPEILSSFSSNLDEEDDENHLSLNRFISEVHSVYSELSQCKRFFEKETFTRIAKDHKILEIAENADNNMIFVTYSAYEKHILQDEFTKLGLNPKQVEDINWMSYKHFDRNKTKILLPGPLHRKNIVELFLPYKEIMFLAYDGLNYERIKDQTNLVLDYSFEEEKFSMGYISEIYEFLKISKNNELFKDFKIRKEQFGPKMSDLSGSRLENPFEEFKNKIQEKFSSSNYQKEIDFVDEKIKEMEKEEHEIKHGEYLEVYLRNLSNENKYLKRLPIEKTYFYLKTLGGNVLQGLPKNFRPGNYIVILENDEKKSLLQLIIDLFGLEENVKKNLIEYWKNSLIKFVNKENLSYKTLYELYSKKGGKKDYDAVRNWANGAVIGPEKSEDLLIIGETINNKTIIEYYEMMASEIEKVRVIHRIAGKRIQKIIKTIIFENKELNVNELNYEEYIFYEKVKNGIYEILEIKDN